MSNFLIPAWEGGGNITPVLEAARRLVNRGHRVRFLGEHCNRADAEANGLTFIPWTTAPNRRGRTPAQQDCRDWAYQNPMDAFAHVVKDIWCGPSLAYANDTLAELKREPADLVIANEMLYGVLAACESIGQRCVMLCANIRLAPTPGIPPIGPGLPPAVTPEDHALHAQIAAAGMQMMDAGLPILNATRAHLGLPPLAHLVDQFEAAEAELLATSRHFDFPSDQLPSRVRYVGPLIADPSWAQSWTAPWPTADTRPLITVGFSTTFQNHAHVLQNVIDALAPLPVKVLITLGGSIEHSDLKAAPNTYIVDAAPHTRVMKQAALVITHGGHGTVMRALVNRVPTLILPHGRDQNDNAIRVSHRGAGLTLMPPSSAADIRAACLRLLNDPTFKKASQQLGDAIAADAHNCTIVDELESAALSRQLIAA